MATKKRVLNYRNIDNVPVVYFDVAPVFGVLHGAAQIELASRILSPGRDGISVEFHTTARVRCTHEALKSLIRAAEQCLEMIERGNSDSNLLN